VTRRPQDAAEVAAIRRRDPATLERIARTNLPLLLRAARAAGVPEDNAHDAVQDTLLIFVRRAEDFDGRAPVESWLLGILYRTLRSQRRNLAREEPLSQLDDSFESRFNHQGMWVRPPVSPERYSASAQAMSWLRTCLEELNDRRRLAFVLREVEQLETHEICKILEVTPNSLGVLLFRARNALRDCMESKGIRGAHDVAM
jgi:RNA polymerase sigma-70 factor (ECF subfamily)